MATGKGAFSPLKTFQKFLSLEIRITEMMTEMRPATAVHHAIKVIDATSPSDVIKFKKKERIAGMYNKKAEN